MSSCLFCDLVQKKANVLYEDEKVFVMLAPDPAIPGHLLVLPKVHTPIFETVPDPVAGEMFKVANKLSTALFEGLQAHGTNILIQSGPTAGQKHNHAMIHVVPRFENDNLQLAWNPKPASEEELTKAESALKDETKSVGIFEKEKPKPIEAEKPKEIKKEDERLKRLRRIP